MSTPVITPELIVLDADFGPGKDGVINALVQRLTSSGRANSAQGLRDAIDAREAQSATGLPGGIAIPHCRSAAVETASLGFARLAQPADFGAADGPADIVFMIAAPDSAGSAHMKILSKLARALMKKDFVAGLRSAATADEVVALVDSVVNPAPKTVEAKTVEAPAVAAQTTAAPAKRTSILAITACPTGIAHTYMAAEALQGAAASADVDIAIETQGSSGTTPFTAAQIANADAVIFATDVGVKGKERFAGKPVVASGVKRAINEPAKMINEAVTAAKDPNARRVDAQAASSAEPQAGELGWGTRIRQILLTGVSYMIPFVAAGGLLIALGFLFGGYEITKVADDIVTTNTLTNLPAGGLMTYIGAVLFKMGALAFGFLVPALAGYIAFAIADRPGIAPGFTAGAIAVAVGAGFIGGLVGGLIAGFVAYQISKLNVPRFVRGLMPVVIIPLFATLIAGGAMFLVLGRPLAALTEGLTNWLNGMSGAGAVLLGIILGLMMCFDLGGPVNKAAYAFAVAGLSVTNPASLKIMAAVMAAGMVPPLAMALATVIRPKLFTEAERENGVAAWLLGASFISEGAIPFAAADPLRVIPSMMAGGALTGALIMAEGVTLSAPHGGLFVLFAIGGPIKFIVALAAGTVLGAAAVVAAKSLTTRPVPALAG
ncbi:fructose-specific PTS transporter subunit EIIC [Smaragdicoccus niigatensis]|uniref:PTS fructose transporter subunit IIABC n=1 Tax=Smaragdicoccus niigatensis TaxID=359359 RepID=UPI00036FDCB4|nr:fructose-specific PTS transporter subunit EIIC [Smaragdicoccus niigatensis]